MADVTLKTIDDLEYYQGPHAVAGIQFKYAAKGLGVGAWGMNVLVIEPGCTHYPEHDHKTDRQEEVYVVLEGDATLQVGDKTLPLERGMMARVGPEERRKIMPGPQGVTVLAIGATKGEAYQPKTG